MKVSVNLNKEALTDIYDLSEMLNEPDKTKVLEASLRLSKEVIGSKIKGAKELEFLYKKHPECKGKIDSKANLTWNEIATLLTKWIFAHTKIMRR
jgi:hypothetical protein